MGSRLGRVRDCGTNAWQSSCVCGTGSNLLIAVGGLDWVPHNDRAVGGLDWVPHNDRAVGGLDWVPHNDRTVGGLDWVPHNGRAVGGLDWVPHNDRLLSLKRCAGNPGCGELETRRITSHPSVFNMGGRTMAGLDYIHSTKEMSRKINGFYKDLLPVLECGDLRCR
ncbi:hypothetical protein RRG08_019795 [Elysia crispata]|uniref:Uncharacterized protein n=1 Tax=Elysia crispata TaxID=231223 RepID=A0AAE1E669_9GAST|nr:hypothetical protein RRG08_019795 [Elysia crispata]